MSNWTHPQCAPCWTAANPDRPAHQMVIAELETCCWCGHRTEAGIYVRADPAGVPRCTRDHDQPATRPHRGTTEGDTEDMTDDDVLTALSGIPAAQKVKVYIANHGKRESSWYTERMSPADVEVEVDEATVEHWREIEHAYWDHREAVYWRAVAEEHPEDFEEAGET